MTRALVVGSVNVDLVVRVRSLPTPGATVLGSDAVRVAGGKGGNQAAALAQLGASTALCAAVGDDADGAWSLDELRRSGVNTSRVRQIADVPTGLAMIAVDDSGENQIVVARGANAHCRPPTEVDADVLVCQLEIPLDTVRASLDLAKAAGARTVLNAAPPRSIGADLWPLVDLLVVNATEAAAFTHTPGLGALIVTHGSSGASVLDGAGREVPVPAPAVDVVDATGAGDCFTAAAALAVAEGADAVEAARFAVVAASLSVQADGARGSLPTRDQVDQARLRTHDSS